MIVRWLFLRVPRVCLQFVIVALIILIILTIRIAMLFWLFLYTLSFRNLHASTLRYFFRGECVVILHSDSFDFVSG